MTKGERNIMARIQMLEAVLTSQGNQIVSLKRQMTTLKKQLKKEKSK